MTFLQTRRAANRRTRKPTNTTAKRRTRKPKIITTKSSAGDSTGPTKRYATRISFFGEPVVSFVFRFCKS